MFIEGGFLGKSSGYYYDITNLTIKSDGWTHFWLVVDGIRITKVCNNGNPVSIAIKDDNDYNINLFVNNQQFHTSRRLFKFQVDIDSVLPENELVIKSESTFVDH